MLTGHIRWETFAGSRLRGAKPKDQVVLWSLIKLALWLKPYGWKIISIVLFLMWRQSDAFQLCEEAGPAYLHMLIVALVGPVSAEHYTFSLFHFCDLVSINSYSLDIESLPQKIKSREFGGQNKHTCTDRHKNTLYEPQTTQKGNFVLCLF